MKLKKAQKELLLNWIAEGLESDEINQRAAALDDPFSVTRQHVDHYRKTRDVTIQSIREAGEFSALKTGLARAEARVKLLQDLAGKMRDDLFEEGGHGFWLPRSKGVGSNENYERIDYEDFNAAEVAELRGVLDDIAVEVGGRLRKHELTGKDGAPLYPTLDLGKLSDEDIETLERAAEIKDRAERNSSTAIPDGD